MPTLFSPTAWRAAIVIGLGWLIGREFNAGGWVASVVGLLFLFWLTRPYGRFKRWMDRDAVDPVPESHFFWSLIQYPVVRFIKRHSVQQAQLRADIDFFRDSFQALDSAVIVVNQDGRIAWSNRHARELVGIDPERDRGQLLTSLFRAPSFIDYFEKADFSAPLMSLSPLDPDVHLEVRITKYRKNDALIFVRDASERVRLEVMRQDFIANVSHELRTPLTVITGYLDTLNLSAEQLPPIWGETLQKMLEQSQRIDNMVNDLIWLSRLESVPVERDTQLIDINQLLESVLSEARVAAPAKHFALHYWRPGFEPASAADASSPDVAVSGGAAEATDTETEIETAPPLYRIEGVFAELRSAFSNLVQNAIKYTPDGKRISVHCYVQGDQFYVSVVDEGIGIDSVHIPRLTERFYRADESRTSATGGTGLGLAIVKHVLARHQARLAIQSELGKGSVFSCLFPLEGIQ